MKALLSDEREAMDTYDRMSEATCGLSCVHELAAAVIIARAIKDAAEYSRRRRSAITGLYSDED